ncbi:MAG: right-handed parallel beta-helix repeat-containing protein [Candidatus Thorarchaeota archaeon]|jgi:parallel beta-helix repeat protein
MSIHSGLKSITVSPIQVTTVAQYQTSEPLLITSNADFAVLGATGVGTPSDPYTFENLQISDTESGIQIQDTTAYFVISNCKLESNEAPVVIFDNVENGRVEQCEITGQTTGLVLEESRDCSVVESSFYGTFIGVMLLYTSNCTVIDNSIHNNNRGIIIEQSDHCDILNNSIYKNWNHGIEIAAYSHNNTIYGNSIGWNYAALGYGFNVLDNGEDNTFDDNSSIGNFWSDYNESETYIIPGSGGSIDAFAQLLEDIVGPIIVELDDIAIDVETTGNTLTWLVHDEFPDLYVIHENGLETVSTIWNGGNITHGLDHLPIGTHVIRVVLFDGAGTTSSDEVLVSVVSYLLGGIGTEFVLIASGITAACFVIIILLAKKLS